MKDVFISYSHENGLTARRLANALERLGWTVFWDYYLAGGGSFERETLDEVSVSRCVLVLWSSSSVASDWVNREAQVGRSRGVLLPVLIEGVEPPEAFRHLNAVDMINWSGDETHLGFKHLRDDIVRFIGGEPKMRECFETALLNITKYGDTDVLPYPIENLVFKDKTRETLELLQRVDAKFDDFLLKYEPYYEVSLYPAGYFGHRWITQIDPMWNAYFLGLVISVGHEIENKRVAISDGVVFSHRFHPSIQTGGLFEPELGWQQYQERSLEHAKKFDHVLTCDIADFYPRISHSYLREALEDTGADPRSITRILNLLEIFSRRSKYGLPVGGPGARLLSELILHSVDHLLRTHGVTFCRFADDYHIFAKSETQAYERLVLLSEKLFTQGLMLQKSKTRIMSSKEFAATSPFGERHGPKTEPEASKLALLRLSIRFDPYSPGAKDEYKRLCAELDKRDVRGMLAQELNKSRVDPGLAKRLVSAIRFVDPEYRNEAVMSLLKSVRVLYPLLSIVFRTFKDVIDDLNEETRGAVFQQLGELIRNRSYLTAIPAHLACAVRVLAHDTSLATDTVLQGVFDYAPSMVRRDIILAMARRDRKGWIRDLLRSRFADLKPWERRALLVGSHIIGHSSATWRQDLESTLWPFDRVAMEWVQGNEAQHGWTIPI